MNEPKELLETEKLVCLPFCFTRANKTLTLLIINYTKIS